MCFDARTPHFRSFLERLRTFTSKNWFGTQSPESLARVGFFRTSNGMDEVQCFCCGITIFGWEPLDEPLSEHLRWSSSCKFANMLKNFQTTEELLDQFGKLVGVLENVSKLAGADGDNSKGEDVAGNNSTANDTDRDLIKLLMTLLQKRL